MLFFAANNKFTDEWNGSNENCPLNEMQDRSIQDKGIWSLQRINFGGVQKSTGGPLNFRIPFCSR